MYHRLFGTGTVLDTRRGGSEVQVRFSKFAMWLSMKELEVLVDGDGPPVAVAVPVAAESAARTAAAEAPLANAEGPAALTVRHLVQEPPKKKHPVERAHLDLPAPFEVGPLRNRRMIEALRLGLVVPEDIELFTFHRDDELQEFESGLVDSQERGGAVRVIEGDYGTGKSHFLEYVKTMALKRGFLVLRTELDGFEIQPNRPKRIYRSLVDSIATPNNGEVSLRNLIDEAAQRKELFDKYTKWRTGHPYLGPAMKMARIKALGVDGITWGDWIEGDPMVMHEVRGQVGYLPALYDFYKAGNIYANIISGIGHLARDMGYRGTVVMIDEAESLCGLQGYRKLTADDFFKGLILVALGRAHSPFLEETLIRTARRPVPHVYQDDAGIFFIMAFTPRFLTPDVIKKLPPDWILSLSGFDYESVSHLTGRLWEIYRHAYIMPPGIVDLPLDRLPRVLFQQLQKGYLTLRQVIKMLVETYDMIRLYPDRGISGTIDELIRNLPV